jgi:hypothetical protein
MMASFCLICARRYSRLLREDKPGVEEEEEEGDGDGERDDMTMNARRMVSTGKKAIMRGSERDDHIHSPRKNIAT